MQKIIRSSTGFHTVGVSPQQRNLFRNFRKRQNALTDVTARPIMEKKKNRQKAAFSGEWS